MQGHKLYCVYYLICGIFVVACLNAASQYSFAQQSVPDEWVKKWREYELFAHSLQGTGLFTSKGMVSGKTSSYSLSFNQNSHCAVMCSSFGDKDTSIEYCLLANPRYSAEIQRHRVNPQLAVLRSCKLDPNDILPHATLPLFDELFVATSPHFSYCNQMLSVVVKSPSFRVERIEKESLNGIELVRIDHNYIYDMPGDSVKILSRRQGSIYLDPSRCWCIHRIKESEVYLINGVRDHDTKWDVQYETVDHPSGFPIIKNQTIHTTGSKKRNGVEQKHGAKLTMEYQLKVDEQVPDTDFTLTAFGLPEPSPIHPPTRWYLWLAMAGLLCLGVAALFRRLARRGENSIQKPTPPEAV
jgi:hypothetical protein